jgi:hypothetical protein
MEVFGDRFICSDKLFQSTGVTELLGALKILNGSLCTSDCLASGDYMQWGMQSGSPEAGT